MAKLDKGTLALTFKFDCDGFSDSVWPVIMSVMHWACRPTPISDLVWNS